MEHIKGDIVGSFAINRISVHHYFELLVGQVKLNCTNTVSYLFTIHFVSVSCQLYLKSVQIRFPNSVWPPELWFLNYCITIDCVLNDGDSGQFEWSVEDFEGIIFKGIIFEKVGLQFGCKVKHHFILTDYLITNPNIVNSDFIPNFQLHILPNSHADQLWSPVPRVLITRFS